MVGWVGGWYACTSERSSCWRCMLCAGGVGGLLRALRQPQGAARDLCAYRDTFDGRAVRTW